jgi:hypothetical protein
MLTSYSVHCHTGDHFTLYFNPVEAAAPITATFDFGDDDPLPTGTPFQTASASHRHAAAAQLVADYFHCGRVRSVYQSAIAEQADLRTQQAAE